MKTEEFLTAVQQVIVGLLLTAVALFIIASDTSDNYTDNSRINQVSVEHVAPAFAAEDYMAQQFANIRISTHDRVSLAMAYLLVNGEQYGDFSQGEIIVRVYPGDVLSVDCRAYSPQIYFYIDPVSASLDHNYLQKQVCCVGDIVRLGVAVFVE